MIYIISIIIIIILILIFIITKSTDSFNNTITIPKIIHQTWKTSTLPDNFKKWSQTIKDMHPTWEYKLWTDEDNRNFIKDNYNWFLTTYDNYNMNIKKVDSVRYFYLYHFGGVYIDLDFECLKPLDNLISNKRIILGEMGDGSCSNCIPNAIMISRPNEPFWLYVILKMIQRDKTGSAEYDTGPQLLKECYDTFIDKNIITLEKSDILYPIDWTTSKGQELRANIPTNPKELFPNSYMVTYWTHSW